MENQVSERSKRYLIIEAEHVLKVVKSEQSPQEQDLLISQSTKDAYQVLTEGVRTIELLETMIAQYNCEIVLLTTSAKKTAALIKKLDEACKKKGFKAFPTIKIMIVGDVSCFCNVSPEKPIDKKTNGIWTAGYGAQIENQVGSRIVLRNLLNIPEKELKNHFIYCEFLII